MPRFDITTFGEGQLRYSVRAGHRLELTDQLDVHVACTEANVASLLSRLGWRAGWISGLPATPLGRRVANEFRMAGVDMSAMVWAEAGRVASYYVEYAAPPRATQVYFDRANTVFTSLAPDQVDWDYLLDTRLFHVSGLTLPLSPTVAEIVSQAVRRAKAAGVPVSFDMNFRRRVWPPEQARDAVLPLFRDVSVLFCGRRDAQQVFGIEGQPEDIVVRLGELTGAQHIVVSLSGDGLIGWDRSEFHCEAAREVTILDRIGAGDAMVAGVLHGWLQGNFPAGIRYGALTAALALSQYGDQVVTTRAEVEALLDATGTDIVR
jgi:2-dehydro-3-deoxygluconokinase